MRSQSFTAHSRNKRHIVAQTSRYAGQHSNDIRRLDKREAFCSIILMDSDNPSKLPFTAVFPDTNVFLPRWPEEPAALAELVSVTRLLDIPVYLLESVEIELEAHQLREARDAIQEISKLSGSLHPLVRAAVKVETVDWEQVRSKLRANSSATKLKLGLRSSLFPALPLQDLFEMAANHEHPFADKGRNFQDAVILRSVIETSRLQNLREVAFVSKNEKDFNKAAVLKRGKESGITLHFYPSLAALHDALWPHVAAVVQALWMADNRLGETAVKLVWNELETFLRSQFVHGPDVTLQLLSIGGVQTAWWEREYKKQSEAALRFVAEVRFAVAANEPSGVQQYKSEIERGITVEGWATFTDGAYGNVQFESAFISR